MGLPLEPLLDAVAARIIAAADELTALDSAIGDADHGLNMKRGFEAVQADKAAILAKPQGEALKAIGMALVMKVGGASGPLYGTLFVLARVAIAGDYKRFLERTAKIQAGLVVCVYCLSYAAALLHVRIGGKPGGSDANFRLLFFLILLVQFADCMQYAWSRMAGRRPVAPEVSSTRTWEGLLGSATSTALLAAVLWWAAPPFEPWQAALVGFVVAVMGFAGGMTMSAIKRDRGVKDYGTLVVGHGGVLDRVDSMCFAAPVFYHLTLLVANQ